MKLLADEGVVALGIELGISQHAAHRRSMCMGLSDQCRADWNKMSCLSRSTTDGWPRLSRASRFDLTLGHDSAMRTSRRYGMRERPINSYGLARADQGYPRAALDANDGWIRPLRAQHPVQSYRQLARRCHLSHRFRLLVAAMQILSTKLGIVTHCDLRRFHQQHAQHAVALLGDRPQLLPSARGVLARNQTQVAGHLLAAREAADIAQGQHVGQRRDRTDSGLGLKT